MQLLLAVLAAAAGRRPPGRRALAGVELPGAVARHGAVLLAWQPPAVSMATQRSEKQGGERGNDRLASEKCEGCRRFTSPRSECNAAETLSMSSFCGGAVSKGS